MDITDAHFRTKRISCLFAPAAMAARMCRRVPSGLRFVCAAFKPTLTSSMNLVGKTPSVQGFVVIFTACSAQAGSHSRSLLSAAAHGLAAWSLPGAFAVSSPVAIFFPPFSRVLCQSGIFLVHWMNNRAGWCNLSSAYFGVRFCLLESILFYTQASNAKERPAHLRS